MHATNSNTNTNASTKTRKQTITIDFLCVAVASHLIVPFKFPVNWHCSQTVLRFESFGQVWRRRPFIWLYIFPVCFSSLPYFFAACFFSLFQHWQTFVAYELKFNFRMSERVHECKNKNSILALTSAETATSMTNIYLHFFYFVPVFLSPLAAHILHNTRKHTFQRPHTLSIRCSEHTFPTIGRSLWMNFNLFYMCLFNTGFKNKTKSCEIREKFKIVFKFRFQSQFLSDFFPSYSLSLSHV